MWGRRRRVRRWLDGWEPIAEALPQWSNLDPTERDRAGALVERFAGTWTWEAARGFQLTPEVVVTVAASGAVLGLGLDVDAWRHVKAVVVHPRAFTNHGERSTTVAGVVADGPQRLLGHARDRQGPVMVSWAAARRDVRHPERGQHVIVHELAHKLDAADGLFDGTPGLLGGGEREEWVRVCASAYRRLRRRTDGDPVLRRYATTNPSEFFAVATEAFIQRPLALEEHHAELYRVLAAFYGQDPAGRARRSATGPA